VIVEPRLKQHDEPGRLERARPIAAELLDGEGQQLQYRRATGEALADLLHQDEALRARENHLALVSRRVDVRLEVPEGCGRVLHSIDDQRRRVACEELGRRLFGELRLLR
jgi:hypothetical protein